MLFVTKSSSGAIPNCSSVHVLVAGCYSNRSSTRAVDSRFPGLSNVTSREIGIPPFADVTLPLGIAKSRNVAPSFPAELDSAVVMLGLAKVEAWNGLAR